MNKIKISSYGIMMLSFFLSTCFFNPFISSIILKRTFNDSWISMLIGFLCGFIILKILLKFNIIKNNNIFDSYNKIVGKSFNLLLSILIILLSSTILIKISTFVSDNYLNNMSVLFIIVATFIVIIYATIKGIEPIVRTSQILFIFTILLTLIYVILLMFYMDFSNILPIFTHSIKDIFISSIYYLVFSILPLILILVIPKKLISDNKINKYILISYTISFIYNLLIVLTIIFVGNNFIIENFDYPIYYITNNIKYFNFIERLDNLFMIPNILGIFMFLIMSLLFINEYIKNIFKIKKDNIYVLSLISIIIIILSFTFKVLF